MKVAIVTDTHFGIRGDSQTMLAHQVKFFKDVFFPTCQKYGITHVIHPGDLVDRRKYINFNTHMVMRRCFLDELKRRNMTMDLLAGNHDVYYKSTNRLNALDELLRPYNNITVFSNPTDVARGYHKLCYIPWINSENEEDTRRVIEESKAQILFGHLELKGFEMFRGQKSEHGTIELPIFDKFDLVFSGHFHQKSTQGNVTYLGAPYQMTWSDWDCPRGMHILDLETREVEFIENPNQLFAKVFYNDEGAKYRELVDFEGIDFKGCYIKIIVEKKTNPLYFDHFVDAIEKMGPADVRVVEALTQADNSDIINQAEDTQTILLKSIDQMDMEPDIAAAVKKLLTGLYIEAINIEVDA